MKNEIIYIKFNWRFGKKDKSPHIHYGINPDLTITFLEDRNMVRNIKREAIKSDGKIIVIENKTFLGEQEELIFSYESI